MQLCVFGSAIRVRFVESCRPGPRGSGLRWGRLPREDCRYFRTRVSAAIDEHPDPSVTTVPSVRCFFLLAARWRRDSERAQWIDRELLEL